MYVAMLFFIYSYLFTQGVGDLSNDGNCDADDPKTIVSTSA